MPNATAHGHATVNRAASHRQSTSTRPSAVRFISVPHASMTSASGTVRLAMRVEGRRAEVGPQPVPDGRPQLHRAVRGTGAEQADAAQDEGEDGRLERRAGRVADGRDVAPQRDVAEERRRAAARRRCRWPRRTAPPRAGGAQLQAFGRRHLVRRPARAGRRGARAAPTRRSPGSPAAPASTPPPTRRRRSRRSRRSGPSSGAWPFTSIRCSASAAVKPAVPRIIASRRSRPAGSGTTQSAGTRTTWAKPPSCVSPSPMPLTSTGSPGCEARVGRRLDAARRRRCPALRGKRL